MQLYAISVIAKRQSGLLKVDSTVTSIVAFAHSMESAIDDAIRLSMTLALNPVNGYHSHEATAIAVSDQLVTKAYESIQNR